MNLQQQTISYIIQYLVEKPYKEVVHLIEMIQKDIAPKEEEVKEEKE